MNALIIENNLKSGASLELFALYNALEKKGVQVHSQKGSSPHTISVIQKNTPDCILIFSEDPNTALETCREICGYCKSASIPVFLISRNIDRPSEIDANELKQLGVSRVFNYPIHPDRVTDVIVGEREIRAPVASSSDSDTDASTDEEPTRDKESPGPAIEAITRLAGVQGCIKVSSDGATLDIWSMSGDKKNSCHAGVAYCGNAAQSIGEAWKLGKFLHGVIIGPNCRLLLHPDGEDFLGTSIEKDVSASHIGQKIELCLQDKK